jgi:hypothetical protein
VKLAMIDTKTCRLACLVRGTIRQLTLGLTAILAGCATHQWVPGPGAQNLDFQQVQAQCSLLAENRGGSFEASGSPRFVAGATLGYALGDAVRQQDDFNTCMLASGWTIAVPTPTVNYSPYPLPPDQTNYSEYNKGYLIGRHTGRCDTAGKSDDWKEGCNEATK